MALPAAAIGRGAGVEAILCGETRVASEKAGRLTLWPAARLARRKHSRPFAPPHANGAHGQYWPVQLILRVGALLHVRPSCYDLSWGAPADVPRAGPTALVELPPISVGDMSRRPPVQNNNNPLSLSRSPLRGDLRPLDCGRV